MVSRALYRIGAGVALVLTFVAAFPHDDPLVNDAPLLRLLAFITGVVATTAFLTRSASR